MGYIIQSVQLRRDKFTRGEAYAWMREHGFRAEKVETTPHYYRFRQHDPERFHGGRFRTIHFGSVGDATIMYF